jgi:hypothetical protein
MSNPNTEACGTGSGANGDQRQPTVEELETILRRSDGGAVGLQRIHVALSSSAADVLRCLFFHGPTWDGNVPSKQGRDELVRMGLAQRGSGWQWLTGPGMDAAFGAGIHREKEQRESREQKRRYERAALARAVLGEDRSDVKLVNEFLGFLLVELPELHHVEAPRLSKAWEEFKAGPARAARGFDQNGEG